MLARLTSVAVALSLVAVAGCSGDDSSTLPSSAGGGGGSSGAADSGVGTGGAAGAGGHDAGSDCPASVAAAPGLVVTDLGAVQGVRSGTAWVYKGIPYAASPTGELRWKPPQPHGCYDGVFDATSFGPKCPQLDETSGSLVGDEDCLQLNVWAPDSATEAPPLPVMLFIHGGGNIQGSSSEDIVANVPIYEGTRLAAAGPVVVVTINYRLGPLGFLALPELAAESQHGVSGNYGILDQISALQWVQRNIRAFGGDPSQVTIFGESAGALDTCVLLASPQSKGLFHRALMESGSCTLPSYADVESAQSSRVTSDSSCGADADRLACLRGQLASTVVGELPGSIAAVFSTDIGGSLTDYRPVVDGWLVPKSPDEALTAGAHNHVPFVIGSNSEEMAGRLTTTVTTEAQYTAVVRAMFDPFGAAVSAAVLAAYPVADYASPQDALIALLSDARFTCPAGWIAQAAAASQQEPVYRYFFARQAELANGKVKPASHGIELLYVFGTLHDIPLYSPAPGDSALSDDIMAYWTRFGRSGDPNGNGAVAWPAYDASTDPHLVLDSPVSAGQGVRKAQCDMWASLLGAGGN